MSSQKIVIPLKVSDATELTQACIRNCLADNVEVCSEAASIWARLHYGHASYVDGSLAVKTVEFLSDESGKAALSFDWTFQDGCSDIFRNGDGYVEIAFFVMDGQLNLKWAWPEQASTVDEF